jgi:hypothetical protein
MQLAALPVALSFPSSSGGSSAVLSVLLPLTDLLIQNSLRLMQLQSTFSQKWSSAQKPKGILLQLLRHQGWFKLHKNPP